MLMAVEGPAANQQMHPDDQHRMMMLNRNDENVKKWKEDMVADAPKWAQINAERVKVETEERDQLREKWKVADTESRMKSREREGEMARGGGGMMNGAPQFHPGMQPGMSMPGMHPSPMYPHHHPSHPHHMAMYGRMQPMQHPSMVGHPSAAPPANGMSAVDANSRKRPSTTPIYEDQSKRMMMESSAANRYSYPPGTIVDPQNGYPVYPQYQMSPYGMPYTTPSCAMQQQPQQMQQQAAAQQQQPQAFPLLPPSTSTSSGVSHTSPNTSSSSTNTAVPPSVPSSSSSAPPSSQHDATLCTSKDDLDALSHPAADNVDVNGFGEFSGNDLGGDDLGLDGDPTWTGGASTSNGGGPSSLPPPHSNGTNGVVLPPGTASAPHSNRMPTPGGAEEMGGGPSSSSTHASPLTASPFHPSPHQSYAPLNGLMNHVSSVGAQPDNGHNGQSMPLSSHLPPRTPTTLLMGPPSDSSTPYPHMSHVSSLPHHLQSSFPMTTSSHTQPSLLSLHSSSLPPIHPHSIPQVVAPPAPPAKKSRSKKAAAPKATPPVPQPPVQFPLNGGMYSMPHPSMTNQFAPPPGAVPSMPPHPSTAGMTPQEMAALQQQQQQYHNHVMMMRQHQMAMYTQQMQRQGMAAPPSSSAPGMLPSPQGGMMTAGGRMPQMGVPPGAQQMTSPSMMMTPQQQQQQQQHMMMMQHHQRIQQMQQMRYMQQPYMDPQQQQIAMQQHQMQQQQLMQQQQQQQQQQSMQQQPGSAGSGQGSPMVGGAPSQNGVSSQQPQQSVPSPFNGSHPQINSPAYTNQSAPFPFAGAAAPFHPMNSSQ